MGYWYRYCMIILIIARSIDLRFVFFEISDSVVENDPLAHLLRPLLHMVPPMYYYIHNYYHTVVLLLLILHTTYYIRHTCLFIFIRDLNLGLRAIQIACFFIICKTRQQQRKTYQSNKEVWN